MWKKTTTTIIDQSYVKKSEQSGFIAALYKK